MRLFKRRGKKPQTPPLVTPTCRIGITPYPGMYPAKTLALRPQAVRFTLEGRWDPTWLKERVAEIRAAVPDCEVYVLLQDHHPPPDVAAWLNIVSQRLRLLPEVTGWILGNELSASKYWEVPREAYVPWFVEFADMVHSESNAKVIAAGQTRGEIMHERQIEWVTAVGGYTDAWCLHLHGPPESIAEPILRMRELSPGKPIYVDELTGTLSASLAQQEAEMRGLFSEAARAGAEMACYIPPDSREVYGRWQPNSLLDADGQERPTYWIMKDLIAKARR